MCRDLANSASLSIGLARNARIHLKDVMGYLDRTKTDINLRPPRYATECSKTGAIPENSTA